MQGLELKVEISEAIMINFKLPKITEIGNTPHHLFDHPTLVSLGILEGHLLSHEILSLQVLCSSGLNDK